MKNPLNRSMMKRCVVLCFLLLGAAGMMVAQVPLCLGDNSYQKKMVKVFEALNEQKLDKAAKYWSEIEEKAAEDDKIDTSVPISQQLSPVWQLSEAMMMNARDGRGKLTSIVPYNPWSAYSKLKLACSTPESREIADLFLSAKSLKMSYAGIKASIEKNLIDTVRIINTEAAYDELLEMLVDCDKQQELEKEREEAAYRETKDKNGLADYQRYLDKYGNFNSNHHFTVEWRRDSLAFEQMGQTSMDCKAYLAAYPNSRFNGTVQELLHRYAFNELDETVAACKDYLNQYPESEFNDSVKALERQYAFRDAKQENKIGSFYQFLTDYPDAKQADEARELLQQSVNQRYFSPSVTLEALQQFYHASDELSDVDRSRIFSLYRNLVFMPTSSFMLGCDGLIGRVDFASDAEMHQDLEVMIFNDQGLLVRHYDSRSGLDDTYAYNFNPENGYELISKTDAHGKVVKYSTKWNEVGDMLEVAGSDGSMIGYARDYDYVKRVIHFNGRKPVKTDYYDNSFMIDKSVAGNTNLSYYYNSDGDIAAVYRTKGKATTDSTTYEYGYSDHGHVNKLWSWKIVSNNGKAQPARYRQFYKSINKTLNNGSHDYSIDWMTEPQQVDNQKVAALIADLDDQLAKLKEVPAEVETVQENVAEKQPVKVAQPVEEVSREEAPVAEVVPQPAVEEEPEETFTLITEEQPVGKENLIKKLIDDMVLVPGGVFVMGATTEQEDDAWELEFPIHQVKLSSFYICKYEVTQALWEAVMGSNPSSAQDRSNPVEMVSWNDCSKFIEKLNEMTGMEFRFPTEAEWEYAARGGNKSRHFKYAGGDELAQVAWYEDNAEDAPHHVGTRKPNELGLHDMSGNVWEWCLDWQNFYTDEIQINPVGDFESQGRVMRGGCWRLSDSLCRVSFRGVSAPGQRKNDCGLRLAASKLTK